MCAKKEDAADNVRCDIYHDQKKNDFKLVFSSYLAEYANSCEVQSMAHFMTVLHGLALGLRGSEMSNDQVKIHHLFFVCLLLRDEALISKVNPRIL
jgi:hypothetical protein